MKTEWDYTDLAEAYLKRPNYSTEAVSEIIRIAGINNNSCICDIGAGAAHLTIELAKYGMEIYAIEPNDAMRKNGILRTRELENVYWYEGVGEDTKMEDGKFDLVTFGSSFNVCNRKLALIESARILKKGGWFACMWNHRDLENPIQMQIEKVIKKNILNYEYGTRREDQTEIILESNLFDEVKSFSYDIIHQIPSEDFIEGWKSHGTVYRQATEVFQEIMKEIRIIVEKEQKSMIKVPYSTKVWMARVKK